MDAHEISPEDLVQHAEFLRGLSRQLVHGLDRAEDAVQETWLAAIEHPPRAAGRLRAWFSRVLRNAARQDLRGERRRPRRERVAARPEPTESTVERAIRSETIERVAIAVTRLEEPYRTTILLRHYQQLAPREIAAQMQAPVDTVKSRLQRAYAHLRQTLGGDGGAFRAALLPLAGPEVVPPTGLPAGLRTTGSAGVRTRLRLAGAGTLLAGCGLALWLATGDTGVSRHPVPPDEPPVVVAHHEREGALDRPLLQGAGAAARDHGEDAPRVADPGPSPAGTPDRDATRTPPATGATTKTRRIEGTVTMKAGTFAGGKVWVVSDGGAPTDPARVDAGRDVPVALDGTFRLEGARAGVMVLRVVGVGLAPREFRVHVGEEVEQRVQIVFGSGRIWGTVFDGAGQPAEGVRVTISSHLREGPSGLEPTAEGDPFSVTVRTDGQGRYDVRGLPSGSFVVVAEPAADDGDARNIRSFAITLADGQERWLDIGRVRSDPRWSGVVRYADGVPVQRAGNVFLESETGESRLYVSFDAEGRFGQEVPPGRYRMEFVLTSPSPGPETHPFPRMRQVLTDERLNIVDREHVADIVFPGVRIAGRVQGMSPGAPPSKRGALQVTLALVEPKNPQPAPLIGVAVDPTYVATVNADGSFFIDGLPPGTYKVSGSPRAIRSRAGADATIEIPSGPAMVELSLVLEPE